MDKRAWQVEQRSVDALIPYDRNARQHPVAQINKIARSIKQFGFNNPILVDAAGVIVAGHGRLRAAKVLGLDTVPVIVLGHLSDAERRAYTLADNRIPAEAKWDKDLLAAELAAVAALPDIDFDALGFSDAEIDKLLAAADPGAAVPKPAAAPAPAAPAIAPPIAPEPLLDGRVNLYCGDCLPILAATPADSVDSVASDPPYGLGRAPDALEMLRAWIDGGHYDVASSSGFMGKQWDNFVPQPAVWKEVLRVLKPGGHVVAFFGTRTYDLGVLAMRLAGFEVRDLVAWLYGQGFPKSHDVGKAIDKAAGAERQIVAEAAPVRRMIPGAEQNRQGWKKNDGRVYVPGETAPATELAAALDGLGTALKPACEPIVLARKPLAGVTSAELHQLTGFDHWCSEKTDRDRGVIVRTARALHPAARTLRIALDPDTRAELSRDDVGGYQPFVDVSVAGNAIKWKTGVLNIDGCRIASDGERETSTGGLGRKASPVFGEFARTTTTTTTEGRWPANVAHDGGAEVVAAFPDAPGAFAPVSGAEPSTADRYVLSGLNGNHAPRQPRGDSGSAACFFYSAKADAGERLGSQHPTVKPVDLMQWLVRLVTPAGGLVLDPFAGTGTTGEAAIREGMRAMLIEREPDYQADIRRRLQNILATSSERAEISTETRGGGRQIYGRFADEPSARSA